MQLTRAIATILLALPLLAPTAVQAAAATDSTPDCSGAANVTVAPARFDLLQPCVTARGVVAMTMHEDDSDYWITLQPDPDSLSLLPDAEEARSNPLLWVKVATDDTPDLGQPKPGDHIAVSGALMWDKTWGWREVRPVWKIDQLPTTPRPPAEVSVSVSGLQVGSSTIYSVVVNNPTDENLSNLTLAAPISAGATLQSTLATPTGATLTVTDGAVSWQLGTLTSGASAGPFVYKVAGGSSPPTSPAAIVQSENGEILAASTPAHTLRPSRSSEIFTVH